MAKRIAVLEATQHSEEVPRLFIKKSKAQAEVRRLEAVWIVKNVMIHRLASGRARVIDVRAYFWDGPIGVGNALPFSRSQNPMMAPAKLHYETPPAGSVGIRRHDLYRRQVEGRSLLLRSRIRVSSRKIAFEATLELGAIDELRKIAFQEARRLRALA